MRFSRIIPGLLLVLAACGPSPVGIDRSNPGTATETPGERESLIESITLSSVPPFVMAGQEFVANATVTNWYGIVLKNPRLTWNLLGSAGTRMEVVNGGSFPGQSARIGTGTDGTSTVVVGLDGQTGSREFTVVSHFPSSTALSIESATLTAFQYPGYAGWYYAPEFVVRTAAANASAFILGFDLKIPGVSETSTRCSSWREIPPGTSVSPMREIYGDYELTFDAGLARATSTTAAATVYFWDGGSGAFGRVDVPMSIRSGFLPISYSGGKIEHPWSCRPV